MLKALPRKPKATGKKPLGAEGWRGVSDGLGGDDRGSCKAEVHRKSSALAPRGIGLWALGAGLVLCRRCFRGSQTEWLE